LAIADDEENLQTVNKRTIIWSFSEQNTTLNLNLTHRKNPSALLHITIGPKLVSKQLISTYVTILARFEWP
jgi:hypothetical protein